MKGELGCFGEVREPEAGGRFCDGNQEDGSGLVGLTLEGGICSSRILAGSMELNVGLIGGKVSRLLIR